MTNREKINQMSNEELARFLVENVSVCRMCVFETYSGKGENIDCVRGIRLWLEQEVET